MSFAYELSPLGEFALHFQCLPETDDLVWLTPTLVAFLDFCHPPKLCRVRAPLPQNETGRAVRKSMMSTLLADYPDRPRTYRYCFELALQQRWLQAVDTM